MKQTTNLTHVQLQQSRKKLPQKFWGECLRNLSIVTAGALIASDAFALTSSDLNLTSSPQTFTPGSTQIIHDMPDVYGANNTPVTSGLTYTLTQPNSGFGSVTFDSNTNQFTYATSNNYYSTDYFAFTVSNGTITSPSYTVNLRVADPVLPTASNYTHPTPIRYNTTTAITGQLPAGDDGYSGLLASNGLLHLLAGKSTGAIVTVAQNGTFTYIPPQGFHGTDTFTYAVNSTGSRNSVPATVSLTITSPIFPTATDQTFTMAYNQPTLSGQLNTAADPSGVETVTYLLAQNNAGLEENTPISSDGHFTYNRHENNASTSFGFWVQNSQGMNAGTYHTAYINIDPAPVPLTNVPINGLSFGVLYDAVRNGNLPTASDPSGGNLVLSYVLSTLSYKASIQQQSVSANINGNIAQLQGKDILTLVGNTGAYTFNAQEPGVYEAHYHVHDSIGDSTDALVRFTVQNPLGFIVDQDETLTIDSKITGEGPLVLRGGGLVHLENTGAANDYTVATIVEGGTVLDAMCDQLGSAGTPVHLKDGMIKSHGTWNRLVKLG